MSLWRHHKRSVAHPDWILDACSSLSKTAALYSKRIIPGSIEVPMIVVPVKRILRGVYGSDLRAALALLWQALVDLRTRGKWALYRWWRRAIMRKPIPTADQLIAMLEYEDD